MDNYKLTQEKKTNKKIIDKDSNMLTVDLNSINTNQSRSLGIEIVADAFYNNLTFDKIFDDLKYSPRQKALAKASILGRLINPASEASTRTWFKERTSLIEMLDYDISDIGKNALYEISDLLLSNKHYIEEQLIKIYFFMILQIHILDKVVKKTNCLLRQIKRKTVYTTSSNTSFTCKWIRISSVFKYTKVINQNP